MTNIQVQGTPNPNAWKFILDKPVLTEGKASFSDADSAYGNRLALDLLSIEGVKQVHFFQNVITISARFDVEPEELHRACLLYTSPSPRDRQKSRMPSSA